VTVSTNAPRDGAIDDEYVAPNWLYSRLRNVGVQVIQYNHPRAGVSGITTIGLFNNIGCNRCANAIDTPCSLDSDCPPAPAPSECGCVGYQPDRPLSMPPNDIMLDDGVLGPGTAANPAGLTNLDFDVMEIANGAKDTDLPGTRMVRRDWLSLLNQGVFRPGTGVSDSHRITVEHAGWARTYVLGAGDDPAAMSEPTFDAQVKAGHMTIGAGPYVEVVARAPGGGRGGVGDVVRAPRGRIRLAIQVRSPAWIPVEEVRIIANGFQVKAFDATTRPRVKAVPKNFEKTGGTSRFHATVTLPVQRDTYFIVEAGAKLPASIDQLPTPPPVVDIVVPGVIPLAITNPIFADVDGNGVYDPPGLPVMPAVRQIATPGLWQRLWAGLGRLRGEVIARDMPGEMTGITRAQKAAAVKRGEYFPIYQFTLPPEAAAMAKEADAVRRRAAEERARR